MRKNIMLMTSNGAGLGHLTRLMAIGDQLRQSHKVMIFTLSRAAAVPADRGYLVEYLGSRASNQSVPVWNRRLQQRTERLFADYSIDAVVFDGTSPYDGLIRALLNHPRITSIWIRRGMWKEGVGKKSIARASRFDRVIEPGDFARENDRGLTLRHQADLVTSPVVLRPEVRIDKAQARRQLGLPQDNSSALLLLGAGQINDTDSVTSAVVRRLLQSRDITIALGKSVLSRQSVAPEDDVHVVSHYPISALYNAFDFAVMAAGYNSFHESLSFMLPTLFVPNPKTVTDDQRARARWAHCHGVGRCFEEDSPSSDLDHELDALTDPSFRGSMVSNMGNLPAAKGAEEASAAIMSLLMDDQ